MIASLKSEFRKLLTVRSTYFTTLFVTLLSAFISIFVYGYKEVRPGSDPLFMADLLYQTLGIVATASVILAILLIAHEYRYNTINYTFSISRSRSLVLFSKTVVLLTYATVVATAMLVLAYFGAKLGLSLGDSTLVTQNLPLVESCMKYLAYIWGYVLMGIVLAVIIRSLVGAIVAFFLIPTAEGILSLILKDDTKYLPFRVLDAIAAVPSPATDALGISVMSNGNAAALFGVYIAVLGTIAALLFIRRDAS